MDLRCRTLFVGPAGIEYLELGGPGGDYLCLQGDARCWGRLRRASRGCGLWHPGDPAACPAPVSLSRGDGQVTALFTGVAAGSLDRFLSLMPPEWQYNAGVRAGRSLRRMQDFPLSDEMRSRATQRQGRFMQRVVDYVALGRRFRGDDAAMRALELRYDHFTVFMPVLRYGMWRHDRLLITGEGGVIFPPSPNCGYGDACEDFAALETDTAGVYPLFCAGAVDGYFAHKIPPRFWLHFALHCALASLWRLATRGARAPERWPQLQREHQRMAADFAGYTHPIPRWYRDAGVARVRAAVRDAGL